MLSSSRQEAINSLIIEQGAVDVADLAGRFSVSASTIRRDLEQLEKKGQIRRVHGGATLPGANQSISKTKKFQAAGSIGRAAANRIRADETVFLGPGRLTLEAAKILAYRSDISVITNCLDIAHWLANHSQLNIIMTGGMVRRKDTGLQGTLVHDTLKSLRAERAFFEAVGVS
ncbi:MAG: DeoR/GlpR transcriptional regulator, partial [Anaerolineales bacterium]|nr:DeoR/GlpR transcriptional regulator [Anaerolineales bacterium]